MKTLLTLVLIWCTAGCSALPAAIPEYFGDRHSNAEVIPVYFVDSDSSFETIPVRFGDSDSNADVIPVRFGDSHRNPTLHKASQPPYKYTPHPIDTSAFGRDETVRHDSIVFHDHVRRPEARTATLRDARVIFFPDEVASSNDGEHGNVDSSGDSRSGKPEHSTVFEVIFPSDLTPNEQPEANSCVTANMTIMYNGTLWKLLKNDNCPAGEWAVLVEECRPACKPYPCPLEQQEYKGRCVDPRDSSVCGDGKILYVKATGSTFCDCEQHYFYDPKKGTCYARRERGPCDFGFFLDITTTGSVECVPNECQEDGFEKDPDSGKCFHKNFVGFCPKDSLQFLPNNTVNCMVLHLRNIFDAPIARTCVTGSRIDHSNQCREEFVVPSITSSPAIGRSCGRSARRGAQGMCRRTNNFFN